MKRKILLSIFSILSLVFLICIVLWATTDYTELKGIVHIDSRQQYVTTEQFHMGSGDYKLPKKYENYFEDGQTVTCKLLVQKYIFTDSTRYTLVEINTVN